MEYGILKDMLMKNGLSSFDVVVKAEDSDGNMI
jgi:hypothetical protein